MTVEIALQEFLVADPGVSAIVDDRIYPLVIPQRGEIPAIVYSRYATVHVPTHGGMTGLEESRFQLSLWGDTPNDTWALADAVEDAVNGFSGDMAGVHVGLIKVVTRLQDVEEADNVSRFRVIMDLAILAAA